jgi:pimeloyl-ACP methyl ester carboxylesterase
VHGLWYRSWSLAGLKKRLRAAGHTVHAFSYPTLARTPARNATDLADFCLSHCSGTIHLVGHSLGGLIITAMMNSKMIPPIGRVVFLGTPLYGSLVAQRLVANPLGKWLLGQSGKVLSEGVELSPGTVEFGMIAGSLPRGLGRITGPLELPNDGTVSVAETVSEQLADRIELKTSHTGLLFSREAAHQAAIFLKSGRFDRG